MTYYSLNRQAPDATFEQAVVKGLAPDKGLYFPASVTPFTNDFLNTLENLSDHDIAIQTIKQFVQRSSPMGTRYFIENPQYEEIVVKGNIVIQAGMDPNEAHRIITQSTGGGKTSRVARQNVGSKREAASRDYSKLSLV